MRLRVLVNEGSPRQEGRGGRALDEDTSVSVLTLQSGTVELLRSVPVGVEVRGGALVVGDGETDYVVTPRADGAHEVTWVLRGVERETVVVGRDRDALDVFLLLAFANAWRDARRLPLLSLWGSAEAQPAGLSLTEDETGWSLVTTAEPATQLATGLRRPEASRLARALAHPLDALVTALQDPDGGGLYSPDPGRGSR